MSMSIIRFGTTALSQEARAESAVGADNALTGLFSLSGEAAYDAQQLSESPSGLTPIQSVVEVSAASAIALDVAVDCLRGLVRSKAQLYTRMSNGAVRWRWARITGVQEQIAANSNAEFTRNMAVTFQPTTADWNAHHHGAPWTFGSGRRLDAGYCFDEADKYTLAGVTACVGISHGSVTGSWLPDESVSQAVSGATGKIAYIGAGFLLLNAVTGTFVNGQVITGGTSAAFATSTTVPYLWQPIFLANGGNATQTDVLVTVTPPNGVAHVTWLTIGVPGISEVAYTGTILDNTSWVMQFAASSVLNNGVNDYTNFTKTLKHTIKPWLQIAPGTNTVYVAWIGGGTTTTITFDYWEAYK
jgi:hypothetical protein